MVGWRSGQRSAGGTAPLMSPEIAHLAVRVFSSLTSLRGTPCRPLPSTLVRGLRANVSAEWEGERHSEVKGEALVTARWPATEDMSGGAPPPARPRRSRKVQTSHRLNVNHNAAALHPIAAHCIAPNGSPCTNEPATIATTGTRMEDKPAT
jgi:hypothetical protein